MKPHAEGNETTEMWKAVRQSGTKARSARRSRNTGELDAVRAAGFEVRKLTAYQYRINGRLDLFVTNRRYHDIRNDERGSYESAIAIVRRVFS